MKYLFALLLATTVITPAFASDSIPFAGDLSSEIINYNRATPSLATSGSLSNGAVAELAGKGITTIIDLRTKAEGTESEKVATEKAGINYVNIPVTGAGVDDEQLKAFTKAYEAAKGSVIVHCASGNRVGTMLTRYYLSKGMPAEMAFERGRTAGMQPSLEETITVPKK